MALYRKALPPRPAVLDIGCLEFIQAGNKGIKGRGCPEPVVLLGRLMPSGMCKFSE